MKTASNSGALQSALQATSVVPSEFEIAPITGVIETETALTLTPFETYLKSEHPLAKIVGELPDMVRSLTTAKQFADVYSFLTANKTIVTPTIETWKSNPNNELENKVRALPEFAGLGITAEKPPYWNESEYQSIVKHVLPLARKDDSHFLTLITSGAMSFVDIAKVQGIWNKWNLHTQSYAVFSIGLNALSAKYELGRETSERAVERAIQFAFDDDYAMDELQSGTYTLVINKENGTSTAKLVSENPYLVKGKTAPVQTRINTKVAEGEKSLPNAFNFTNGSHAPKCVRGEELLPHEVTSKSKKVIEMLEVAAAKGAIITQRQDNSSKYDLTLPTGERYPDLLPTKLCQILGIHLGYCTQD